MALRIAIVGPGRVGTAFARRFVQAGACFVGFVGRDPAATTKQVEVVGAGEVLDWPELQNVHVVVFAVGDGDLAKAVEQAASIGGRACRLWLHTSGRHGLELFAAADPLGVRTGSLHPLLPFSGSNVNMSGAPAVAAGEPRSMRLLKRLGAMLQLQVIEWRGRDGDKQNRTLYHAGCALAANGATALFGVAADLIRGAGGLDSRDADVIVAALMNAAVRAASEQGAARALSGPVRRGDAETVALHLSALQDQVPMATATYVALMQQALLLARDQGLAPADCEHVALALSLLRPSS